MTADFTDKAPRLRGSWGQQVAGGLMDYDGGIGLLPNLGLEHCKDGREPRLDTTQIYLHASLELKEKALAKTEPFYGRPPRSRPPDQLMAFLQGL